MKKLIRLLWALVCTLLWSADLAAAPATTLKVHLTGDIPISFTLYPSISFNQDDDGNLIVSMDNLEMSFPAAQISHFSFSDELKAFSGVEDLFDDLASEDNPSSDGSPVEIIFTDRIIHLYSKNYSSFSAAIYTLSGREVGVYSGDSIDIDTSSFSPDIYILSTCSNSFKFCVR